MASSLHLLISNLVTRSFPLPKIVSASRFRAIRSCTINETGRQSYATMPEDDFYDQSASPRILWPKISSLSCQMSMDPDDHDCTLDLEIPNCSIANGPIRWSTRNREGLCVSQYIYGLEKKDLRACGEHKSKTLKEGIILPHKSSNDIKEEMKDGKLKANIMANILANDILTSFRDISVKRTWAYYDMFTDRSILVNRLCPIIEMRSPISSFSIYKNETSKSLCISMCMPGEEEMKLTTQGLHVTLNLGDLERDNVKTYFNYDDTFYIEGKTNQYHYITGIKLPKGFQKRHNMIEREVKDGVLYAIIPCNLNNKDIKFI